MTLKELKKKKSPLSSPSISRLFATRKPRAVTFSRNLLSASANVFLADSGHRSRALRNLYSVGESTSLVSETKDFRDAFSLWRTGTKRATVTWSREGERTKKSTERDARATGAQITRKSKTRLSLWSAVVPRPRWLDGDTSGVAECVLATVVLTASGGRPDAGTVLGSREKRETLHTDDNIVTPIARPRTGGSSSEGYAFVNRCCTPARHPPACTGAYRKQSSLSNTIPPRF